MKAKSHLFAVVCSAIACIGFTCCTSESTSLINIDVNGADAFIRMAFSVEGTRAEINETELKVIDIYVFDEDGKLETSETIEDESASVQCTSGYKTIYAIAGMKTNGFDTVLPAGMTIDDFEKLVFSSTLDDFFNDNGCLMIGKSRPTQILKSAPDNIPATNVIPITLVRVMAKASLSFEDITNIQFQFTDPRFCICQTSDKMPVVDLATAITHDKVDGEPTFTNLSNPYDEEGRLKFVSADEVQYMAENISVTHMSGNTTFLAIAVRAIPQKVYGCVAEGAPEEKTIDNPDALGGFYVVGVENPDMGIVDYAVNAANEPYCFLEESDALNFATSLNASIGQSSESGAYGVIKFESGIVYYKVNFNTPAGMEVTSYGKYSVLRNRHYTISIKSVNKLGASKESILFPRDPETPADVTNAYLNATFTVEDWEDVNQETVLQ